MEPAGPTLVRQRIGVYDVEALIGAGGMGVVYRARDSRLNRPVAIKLLSNAFASPTGRWETLGGVGDGLGVIRP